MNILKQLKLKWKVWICLQNQINILKCEWNESEKKFTAEIAVLKDILKRFRDNYKTVMLKWIMCNNFITDLIWFN